MDLPDTNPKTRFGVAKPAVADIPPVAILTLGQGMSDGTKKYGRTNWREHEVTASVYYNAAMRHLMAWWDGEKNADDSGVHHLGHAMACQAILVDAEASEKLVDDRPSVPGTTAEYIKRMTKPMEGGETRMTSRMEGGRRFVEVYRDEGRAFVEEFEAEARLHAEEVALRARSVGSLEEATEIILSLCFPEID